MGRLILITAIHHVRRSLPPHVCFDLFLSSTVTVKDEGPCGRAGAGPWKAAAHAAVLGPNSGPVHTGHSFRLELHVGAGKERTHGGHLAGWLIADLKV